MSSDLFDHVKEGQERLGHKEAHSVDPSSPTVLRFAHWVQSCPSHNHEFEPSPDGVGQWKVVFDVLIDHWVHGTDEALLWMDANFLYVVGKTTSFAIPGHRLKRGVVPQDEPFRPFQRRYLLPIESDLPDEMAIQFDVQEIQGVAGELREAIASLVATCDPHVEGQLPPLGLAPTAHSARMIRSSLLSALSKILLIALVFTSGLSLLVEDLRLEPILIGPISLFVTYQLFASRFSRIKLQYQALHGLKKHLRAPQKTY